MSILSDIVIPSPNGYNKYNHGRDRHAYEIRNNTNNFSKSMRKLSQKILGNTKEEIKNRHLKLTLAVILVGNDLVSKSFVSRKEKACGLA